MVKSSKLVFRLRLDFFSLNINWIVHIHRETPKHLCTIFKIVIWAKMLIFWWFFFNVNHLFFSHQSILYTNSKKSSLLKRLPMPKNCFLPYYSSEDAIKVFFTRGKTFVLFLRYLEFLCFPRTCKLCDVIIWTLLLIRK